MTTGMNTGGFFHIHCGAIDKNGISSQINTISQLKGFLTAAQVSNTDC